MEHGIKIGQTFTAPESDYLRGKYKYRTLNDDFSVDRVQWRVTQVEGDRVTFQGSFVHCRSLEQFHNGNGGDMIHLTEVCVVSASLEDGQVQVDWEGDN